MITVNTNMSSIIAQNSLYKSTNKMYTALQRLSTGLRINSAKDDAAGSAVSTKLEYKISSYDVAKDNAQMGQSMLDTASGSLGQINSMLQRMRDLSEQAANGTYGNDEKKAMQSEIDALTEEIYRIKNTTEFNGKKILGEEEPSIKRISEAEAIAQGYTVVKTAKELYSAFHNTDGSQKLDAKVMLFADIDLNELGDLDGNGSNWEAIGAKENWSSKYSYAGIFDGNGYTINNLKICNAKTRGQGFIGLAKSATIKNINFNNCSVSSNKNSVGVACGYLWHSEIQNCTVSNSNATGTRCVGGLLGELDASTAKDCTIINSTATGDRSIGGSIGYLCSAGGIVENIYSDVTVNANSDKGAFCGSNNNLSGAKIQNCFYNSERNGTLPRIGWNDRADFDIKATTTNPFKPQEMQVKTNLQVGINSDDNSVISVDTGFGLGDFNISVLNEFSARNSLDKIDAMMNKVMAKMTEIGATQSRLENIMEFQEIQKNALTSANSLIKDADIALESANYLKNQILQNVTSALLSTANQSPQIALQLI